MQRVFPRGPTCLALLSLNLDAGFTSLLGSNESIGGVLSFDFVIFLMILKQ